MISNYNSFILEEKVINLILENNLMASNEFLFKLSQIKDRSVIANILFKNFAASIYNRVDLPQNWIDTTDKDDTISFLPDIKANKILTDEDDEDIFKVKGRNEIKVGRFARQLLTNTKLTNFLSYNDLLSSLKNKDYEDFVNLFKSTYQEQSNRFELISGSDIVNYYAENSYATTIGQLGSSCMRHKYCRDFFEIYTENECVRLLVYLNESGKVLGRSIIWKLSKSPCDAEYFMDRIYTASDSDIIKFQNYANSEGWLVKYKNTSYSETNIMFTCKGNPVLGKIKVDLDESRFNSYPYMDTLTYINVNKGFASNFRGKNMISCDDTDGSAEEICYTCNGHGIYSGTCQSCIDGESTCNNCDGLGRIGNKNCEKCDGSGEQKCDSCGGTSILNNVTCPDCLGQYKTDLNIILSKNSYSDYHKQAEIELSKLNEKKSKKI